MKKKVVKTLMICGMGILLCACGKSEEAQKVDDFISGIGEVTLESEGKIIEAEKSVENLTEKHKKQLDNVQKLEEARDTYEGLVVGAVEEKISKIESVTLKSKSVIETARKAYDQLNKELQPKVSNYNDLALAEEKFVELRVKEVEKKIEDIGKVTIKSKKKIDAAQKAYNALSATEKKAVANVKTLTKAEITYKTLEKEQKKKEQKEALAVLNKETDEVQGITFYLPKTFPTYINTRSYMLPYLGVSGEIPYVKIRFNYTGEDWVFFKSVIIVADGKKFYQTFEYFNIEHDNDGGDVWENIDITASDDDIEMLEAVAKSKKTIIRFEGDHQRYDLTVKEGDKKAIKQVLKAYKLMK